MIHSLPARAFARMWIFKMLLMDGTANRSWSRHQAAHHTGSQCWIQN